MRTIIGGMYWYVCVMQKSMQQLATGEREQKWNGKREWNKLFEKEENELCNVMNFTFNYLLQFDFLGTVSALTWKAFGRKSTNIYPDND